MSFLKRGNCYSVTSAEAMDMHASLPALTLSVKFAQERGFYLEEIESLDVPAKIYGPTDKQTDRVLETFEKRGKTTGMLLAGEKGSGKTLFAKIISSKALSKGMPTISISHPYRGADFNTFMQSIEQPCVVLIDEFEKVYDKDQQPELLTLLDGIYNSKKLFILTTNDSWRVDIHMRNRPGRLYYSLNFKGLEKSFIREYCEDRLNDKDKTGSVVTLSLLFEAFNFDMLQALVEEMNRYDETAQDALKMLNITPEHQADSTYRITFYNKGKEAKTSDKKWSGNPLKQLYFHYEDGKDEDGDTKWENITFTPSDLVSLDQLRGEIVFENSDRQKVVLVKDRIAHFDYSTVLTH